MKLNLTYRILTNEVSATNWWFYFVFPWFIHSNETLWKPPTLTQQLSCGTHTCSHTNPASHALLLERLSADTELHFSNQPPCHHKICFSSIYTVRVCEFMCVQTVSRTTSRSVFFVYTCCLYVHKLVPWISNTLIHILYWWFNQKSLIWSQAQRQHSHLRTDCGTFICNTVPRTI